MEPTSKERRHSDIRAAAYKYKDIIPKLLAAHALSGCDTVAQCYGIGKTSVVKVLQADHHSHNIDCIGNVSASIQDILFSATSFISKCYRISGFTTMADVCCKVWKIKKQQGKHNIFSEAVFVISHNSGFGTKCYANPLSSLYFV